MKGGKLSENDAAKGCSEMLEMLDMHAGHRGHRDRASLALGH